MTGEERAALLRNLRFGQGQAEFDDPMRDFVPIEEHLRAMDPSVVLVVGDRGAGKSSLHHAMLDERLRRALARFAPEVDRIGGAAAWAQAFPLEREGPARRQWQNFAIQHEHQRSATRDLWLALLVRSLAPHLPPSLATSVRAVIDAPSDPGSLFAAVRASEDAVIACIDAFDRQLEREKRWLFVSYDELDTLLDEDWGAFGRVIRGVVSLWTEFSRRWRAVRAKLFLRTDFYGRFTDVVGADIAKLAANRVELLWSDLYLFKVLLRRFASRSDAHRRYAARAGISFERDATLGVLPRLNAATDASAFIERLCGEHMGANSHKGRSFTWILNAVRDGNRRASPRSLLLLVEEAARMELATPRASGSQLLHHVSLRNALDKVSKHQVEHALGQEWRWLTNVRDALTANRTVPWERGVVEKLLRPLATARTTGGEVEARIRGLSPDELVDYLVELGVFRMRTGNRIDVPDLYLNGLGLVRKGGVKRA